MNKSEREAWNKMIERRNEEALQKFISEALKKVMFSLVHLEW